MSTLRQVLEVARLTIRLYWHAPQHMLAAVWHHWITGDKDAAARHLAEAKRAAGEPSP